MKPRYERDVAGLICGNIDDLRNALQHGVSRNLLERSLKALRGRETKTKRQMLERALRKLPAVGAVVPTEAQIEAAFSACRSIRFAVTNAERFGGEFSLNDILAADRLAREALEPKVIATGAKDGGVH